MSRIIRGTVAAAFAAAMLAAPVAAQAAPSNPCDRATENWGQQVRCANQTENAYPGNTSRGEYVSDQAQDDDGPGYGWEIQNLDTNIGNQRN
ncbi:hypothetical protein [Kocuria sp. LHG3120]|uniref:hypothetical protein n=1 Tax=Kocuria sp. LHG3120 TaxID=2804590 RepID=UPI003CF33028